MIAQAGSAEARWTTTKYHDPARITMAAGSGWGASVPDLPGCVATSSGRFTLAGVLIGLVAFEVVVLLVNAPRRPLTGAAARCAGDRQDNFDIHLSLWLARYNHSHPRPRCGV